MKQTSFDLELLRVADLDSYDILDTPEESQFTDLSTLAMQLSGCSFAAISFLDDKRQWFKSCIGMDVNEIDREDTVCNYTIREEGPLVITNLKLDPRFAGKPYIAPEDGVRFYAGVPIVSRKGYNIGTVCVFDTVEREVSEQQIRSLEIVARQVMMLLELRLLNRETKQKAREIIRHQKQTVKLTLDEQELERQFIGTTLHENFAQVLAACLMYINLADDNKSFASSFLQKTREELQHLLNEMRKLSRTYNPIPVSLRVMSLEDILEDFVEEFRQHSKFEIELHWKGESEEVNDAAALNLFRILVQYLHLLDKKPGVTKVKIDVHINDQLILCIGHDGPAIDDKTKEQATPMLSRIHYSDGHYELKRGEDETHCFQVWLPIAKVAS